jgi:hypothetical protein
VIQAAALQTLAAAGSPKTWAFPAHHRPDTFGPMKRIPGAAGAHTTAQNDGFFAMPFAWHPRPDSTHLETPAERPESSGFLC